MWPFSLLFAVNRQNPSINQTGKPSEIELGAVGASKEKTKEQNSSTATHATELGLYTRLSNNLYTRVSNLDRSDITQFVYAGFAGALSLTPGWRNGNGILPKLDILSLSVVTYLTGHNVSDVAKLSLLDPEFQESVVQLDKNMKALAALQAKRELITDAQFVTCKELYDESNALHKLSKGRSEKNWQQIKTGLLFALPHLAYYVSTLTLSSLSEANQEKTHQEQTVPLYESLPLLTLNLVTVISLLWQWDQGKVCSKRTAQLKKEIDTINGVIKGFLCPFLMEQRLKYLNQERARQQTQQAKEGEGVGLETAEDSFQQIDVQSPEYMESVSDPLLLLQQVLELQMGHENAASILIDAETQVQIDNEISSEDALKACEEAEKNDDKAEETEAAENQVTRSETITVAVQRTRADSIAAGFVRNRCLSEVLVRPQGPPPSRPAIPNAPTESLVAPGFLATQPPASVPPLRPASGQHTSQLTI